MGKGTLARQLIRERKFFHTRRKKILLDKIQRCIKCGSKSASIIFEKSDLEERIAIIHCHKCGYHHELAETEILPSGKRAPALETPDFMNKSWDIFRQQLRATA